MIRHLDYCADSCSQHPVLFTGCLIMVADLATSTYLLFQRSRKHDIK